MTNFIWWLIQFLEVVLGQFEEQCFEDLTTKKAQVEALERERSLKAAALSTRASEARAEAEAAVLAAEAVVVAPVPSDLEGREKFAAEMEAALK